MTAAATDEATQDVPAHCQDLAAAARAAGHAMATAPGRQRNAALHAIAAALRARTPELLAANEEDLAAAEGNGLSDAMIDRLRLTGPRIERIAEAVDAIAAQPDPVGRILEGRVLDNGIRLSRVRVPLGVVFIVFESRPNVTADAAALCLKSGNAAILRGGKEAAHSNRAIHACVAAGLGAAGLPAAAVQLVGTPDRAAVTELLKLDGLIDVCIPRGGESLIRAVVEQSRIPVIKHYTGNCHVYVDASADPDMAEAICLNAKTQRTGVCNAAETILFHEATLRSGLAGRVVAALLDAGVELHAGDRLLDATPAHPRLRPATAADWAEEYLSMECAVEVVASLDEATDHINRWGSRHTDAIVTGDLAAADRFVARVDTANAMVNCSTRFSDGQQYGLGAEIGISTDKLHARGPMGAEDLTTYQWVARGDGQVRS
ncbi:glutamate-5-semialdehyde dehydrogenase [Phycisphaera mikurensis]|uniref:Gamma-glutamyl phosphate reductase n=1 Tax=Phycisphaera mikurensis (strain NBRC 102666 / KCTC 22515 / FYK2301M01) TaxID=1142394 RepID=I0IFH3_PHYMF|nr:glutamate-5-semialdehyde dehydrogenase [Phycisphaera mikurensis]MBB6440597.1 glutamate-5-semialdehyde dehydrogenase [Phycisphaera mikurensis]BAM04011.1 gamma-glutamyl phosphate reductase [Phycisphaera mikurensis NBRC 102666]